MAERAIGAAASQTLDGRRAGAVYLLFFASGAAALIYEVSWARQTGLLVGHTADGGVVVLTAYFAGLAVGYVVGAGLAGRVKPLPAYAVAELAAAAWACVIPSLLSAADSWGLQAGPHLSSPAIRTAVRWLLCFFVVLPATAALGATLPLVAAGLSDAGQSVGRAVTAYAVNAAGAFAGTVAVTAWLIAGVGVRGSGYVAAGLSATCGVAALALNRLAPLPTAAATSPAAPRSTVPHRGSGVPLVVYIPAAVSGFGVLALEVLYARLFSLVFHNSTYTFGAVLAAAVLALTLGGVIARVATLRAGPRAFVAYAAGAGAVLTALSVYWFAALTRFQYFRGGDGFSAYLAGAFGLAALVVLPPVSVLGAILPAVWCCVPPGGASPGRLVGRTAFVNTLGAAAGSAGAGLLLLPTLGLWGSFAAVSALFTALSVVLLASAGRRASAVAATLAFLVAVGPLLVPPGPERWAAASDESVVRRWTTAYGWIDVVESPDGVRNVRQNMHYRFGTTGADAPRAYRQARLPVLLHPQPSDVLFLGLGTGLTAAGAVAHPEVERAVVVELIPEVVEAARLLSGSNQRVVDHPKFAVEVDDARHYLRTTDRQFDVVVSDLFVPWESEAGYLYTVEHYRAARRRLKPGGVFCLWLAAYQLGAAEFETIADSFAAVFPDTSLWWGNLSGRRAIVALVGSEGPLDIDATRIDARLRRAARTGPADPEIASARDVVARYAGQWLVRRPNRLNTDEHPRVEFSTPVSHRNRTLLQGGTLRAFFDDVLAGLPDRAGSFSEKDDGPLARRGWQRLAVFPE